MVEERGVLEYRSKQNNSSLLFENLFL